MDFFRFYATFIEKSIARTLARGNPAAASVHAPWQRRRDLHANSQTRFEINIYKCHKGFLGNPTICITKLVVVLPDKMSCQSLAVGEVQVQFLKRWSDVTPLWFVLWISYGVSKTLALWPLGAVFTGLSVPLPLFTFVVPRNQQESVDILWEIVFVIAFHCYAECVYHQMRLSGNCWLYLHVCWYHMLVRQISKTTLQCCSILLIPQAQLSSHHNLLLCQIL